MTVKCIVKDKFGNIISKCQFSNTITNYTHNGTLIWSAKNMSELGYIFCSVNNCHYLATADRLCDKRISKCPINYPVCKDFPSDCYFRRNGKCSYAEMTVITSEQPISNDSRMTEKGINDGSE